MRHTNEGITNGGMPRLCSRWCLVYKIATPCPPPKKQQNLQQRDGEGHRAKHHLEREAEKRSLRSGLDVDFKPLPMAKASAYQHLFPAGLSAALPNGREHPYLLQVVVPTTADCSCSRARATSSRCPRPASSCTYQQKEPNALWFNLEPIRLPRI